MNAVSRYVETNEDTDQSKDDGIYGSLGLGITPKFKPSWADPSIFQKGGMRVLMIVHTQGSILTQLKLLENLSPRNRLHCQLRNRNTTHNKPS